MTISRRLIILLGVPLLAIVGLGVLSSMQLTELTRRSREVAEMQIPKLVALGDITRGFYDIRVGVRDHLIASDESERTRTRAEFTRTEQQVTESLRKYSEALSSDGRDRELLNDYRTQMQEYIQRAREVIVLSDQGRHDAAATSLERMVPMVRSLNRLSIEWIQHNESLARIAGKSIVDSSETTRRNLLLAAVLALALTATLGFVTFRKIVVPIRALDTSVKTIAAGDYSKEVPFTTANDETGGLARSVATLKLGAAAMEEQRWVKSNAAQLAGELQGATSLPEFGQRLLSGLVPVLGGGVASLYRYDESAGRFQRLADYGLSNSSSAADSFAIGEGLVGQCGSERRTIALTDLPKGYLNISSGLGGAAPVQVVAHPLISKESVLGVMEFASFRALNTREMTLLEELLPVVSMSLEVLQSSIETQELLEQTQEQSRRLEEQTEELTQSQEELLAQKEELLTQQGELTAQRERLRETEQFFRSVLELAPDGLMVVDEKGVIRLANAQCEVLFGYTRDELIGQSVEMLVPDSVRDRHPHLRASFHHAPAVRGMGANSDLKGLRKNASLFPVEIGLSPLPARQGESAQVAVSIRDVTERREQEQALREAKARAEEATEMKSMFLANMSHEIRTPMNAIIGLSHLALKTRLNAKQYDYISKVHNAGTSLLAIINDILDFSKIEAGKLDIETTDFQVDEVISSVTMVTAQKAHDKGLEFLADVSSLIPEQLRGDPLRLGQILTNLVNNAVKFTEKGEIRLKIELLEKTGEKVQLKFSVRDTGIGMTHEQAARLFQPFSQADMSTTRKHGGTGLGLTISRRLVELMGGQIWLESEPGVGSTFNFTAWFDIGEEGTLRTVPRKLQSLRVLVVDDNAAAREILVESMHNLAERADAVSSGPEAIAAIRERDKDSPYDVVFMDWRMPEMDGLQATRIIKADSSLNKPPAVIIVTAFGREEVREEAESLHVDGFLVKPVTKSMIVDSLVSVFATETDIGAGIKPDADHRESQLRGARILLVEDNDINQQIAIELLQSVGARVEVAHNGRQAVERLINGPDKSPYDLVLMDLQMPEMDGYQATTRIRSDSRFTELPIIAMTAHATLEERNRCLASGMNEHISKPIHPNILFDTVGRFYRPEPIDPSTLADPFETQLGFSSPSPTKSASESLPVVDGLDTNDGLQRLAGNRKLYLGLLRQFVASEHNATARIRERLSSSDPKTAERFAHTVKGVAGNLGAKQVQAAAAALEQAIHEGSATEALCVQLDAVLSPLIGALQASFGEQPAVNPSSTRAKFDAAELREAVVRMGQHLADFDPAAADFLESDRPRFVALFDTAKLIEFEQHIKNYAFVEARTLLDEAAGERGILK